MVAVCRKRRVPFYIHENWRWQKQIRQLKTVLISGVVGRPFRAQIFQVSGYPVFANEPALRDLDEFVLADMGTHLLDVARFFSARRSGSARHTTSRPASRAKMQPRS
jgi:predicted dehydrogenase